MHGAARLQLHAIRNPFVRHLTTGAARGVSLAGTVQLHQGYLLLSHPEPPESYPSKIQTPLLTALQLRVLPMNVIVNFSWREAHETYHGVDAYRAMLFAAGARRLDLPRVSLDNINNVEASIRAHMNGTPVMAQETQDEVFVFVCTHGARDCRCGTTGGDVVKALREELHRRVQDQSSKNRDALRRVRIGEVAHVGGHKFAANVLVFPFGDWLGNITPEDAPVLLDAVISTLCGSGDIASLLPYRWRGRMGLTKEKQAMLAERFTQSPDAF